jgi:hypothetical protein
MGEWPFRRASSPTAPSRSRGDEMILPAFSILWTNLGLAHQSNYYVFCRNFCGRIATFARLESVSVPIADSTRCTVENVKKSRKGSAKQKYASKGAIGITPPCVLRRHSNCTKRPQLDSCSKYSMGGIEESFCAKAVTKPATA